LATPKKKSYEPNYIRRLARTRTARIEKRVGKPMIYSEEAMLQLLIDRKVPTMVQHCILKVKDKVQGSPHEKFISAFNICGWVFQHYGYLEKSNSKMSMTGKGLKRNMQHQKEGKPIKAKSRTKAAKAKAAKAKKVPKKNVKSAAQKAGEYKALVSQLWGPSIAGLKKDQNKDEKDLAKIFAQNIKKTGRA
jgi:hypothetical protein